MSKSLIQEQTFSFAVRIVLYCKSRQTDKALLVLPRQLLRAGTSIGANVEEALGGQSRKDFAAKLGIAAREARETHYWLRLIRRIDPKHAGPIAGLLQDCDELLKILNSIILTTRRNLKHPKCNSELPHKSDLSTNNSGLIHPDSKLMTQNAQLLDRDSELCQTNEVFHVFQDS